MTRNIYVAKNRKRPRSLLPGAFLSRSDSDTPLICLNSRLLSRFSHHFTTCPSFPSQWPCEALIICLKSFGCQQEKLLVCDIIVSLCLQTTQRGIISLGSCILWDPPAPKWSSEEKLWSWSASLRACKSARRSVKREKQLR